MFCNKLKELRIKSGLTQRELSEKLGIGQSTIGMYESDIRKPSYNVLKKIAKFFNVSIDFLLNDEIPDDSIDLDSLVSSIKKLTPNERKQVKDMIDFFYNNYHNKKHLQK